MQIITNKQMNSKLTYFFHDKEKNIVYSNTDAKIYITKIHYIITKQAIQ